LTANTGQILSQRFELNLARAATVLGFDPRDVGYLVYSVEDGYGVGDISQIEVVGTPIQEALWPLKPAPTIDVILGWKGSGHA